VEERRGAVRTCEQRRPHVAHLWKARQVQREQLVMPEKLLRCAAGRAGEVEHSHSRKNQRRESAGDSSRPIQESSSSVRAPQWVACRGGQSFPERTHRQKMLAPEARVQAFHPTFVRHVVNLACGGHLQR
jgi:hypothetical protein